MQLVETLNMIHAHVKSLLGIVGVILVMCTVTTVRMILVNIGSHIVVDQAMRGETKIEHLLRKMVAVAAAAVAAAAEAAVAAEAAEAMAAEVVAVAVAVAGLCSTLQTHNACVETAKDVFIDRVPVTIFTLDLYVLLKGLRLVSPP